MEPDGQRRLLSSTTWHISPGELAIAEACLTLSALLALALLVLLGSRTVVRVLGFLLPPADVRPDNRVRFNHPLLWSRQKKGRPLRWAAL